MQKNKIRFVFLSTLLLLLTGCSSFAGIRTPLYDGEPVNVQPEKIEAFHKNGEIIGEEKSLYLSEPFSEDLLKPSLDYADHEPILLEEGTYTVGVDLPASRVTMIGEKNDPNVMIDTGYNSQANMDTEDYEVGTMTIRDPEGNLYFENMFHPLYGVLITQVDLFEGHTIEIIGNNPSVVLFFAEELPEDPYIFDTRWEDYLAELEAEGIEMEVPEEAEDPAGEIPPGVIPSAIPQEQPIVYSEDGQSFELNAGIYEVGEHFEAGSYEITEQSVPNHTALYIFRESTDPLVFDLSKYIYGIGHRLFILNVPNEDDELPVIEFKDGDKVYPHYVDHLLLTKVNNE